MPLAGDTPYRQGLYIHQHRSLAVTRDLVFKVSIDMLLQTVLGEVQVADGALAFAGSLQVMGGGGGGVGHIYNGACEM